MIDTDGEIALIGAVLHQISRDLRSQSGIVRLAAEAWMNGANGSLYEWANLLGVEPALLQEVLVKGGQKCTHVYQKRLM